MIYAASFSVSVFFSLIAFYLKKSYKIDSGLVFSNKIGYYICFVLSLFPAFLLSAVRDISIGTDTGLKGTYYKIFNYVQTGNASRVRDKGFSVLNIIANWIFGDYRGIIFLTSFVFCFITFWCIYKYSYNYAESIYLLYATNVYFISMNMIRQSIGIVICYISFKFIQERNLWKFLICVLIAASMHTTLLMFLPVYFIYNIKLKPKKVIWSIVTGFIISQILYQYIIDFILKFQYFRYYFGWYLKSDYNKNEFNVFSILVNLAVLALLLYVYKQAKDDKQYNLFLWMEVIAIIALLFSKYIPLMQRVSWIFSFVQFLFLPAVFRYIRNDVNRAVIKSVTYLGFGAYMFLTIFIKGYHDVYPYMTMFSKIQIK